MKQEHSALQAEIDELKKLVPGPDQDKTYSAITAKVQLQTRTEALEMQAVIAKEKIKSLEYDMQCLQEELQREKALRETHEKQLAVMTESSQRVQDETRTKMAEDFASERQQKEKQIQQLEEIKEQLRIEADQAVSERDEWKRKHEDVVARMTELYKERSQWRQEIPGVQNITDDIIGSPN